jgi:hypothetical protein
MLLHAGDQVVVVGVRADPEPDHGIVFSNTQRPVIAAYPYRVDRLCRVDLLETQPGVIRILDKPPVGFPRSFLNGLRQARESLPKSSGCPEPQSDPGSRSLVSPLSCSSSASRASTERASCVSAMRASHLSSEESSASSHSATAFCSSSDSREAASNAFLSSSVTSWLQA